MAPKTGSTPLREERHCICRFAPRQYWGRSSSNYWPAAGALPRMPPALTSIVGTLKCLCVRTKFRQNLKRPSASSSRCTSTIFVSKHSCGASGPNLWFASSGQILRAARPTRGADFLAPHLCRENPDAEIVPFAATGHDTIYEWRCIGHQAVAGKRFQTVDPQGFIAENWREVK